MRSSATVLAAFLMAACATDNSDPSDTVRTAQAAIDIGRNKCRGVSDRPLSFFDQRSPASTWHAQLDGVNWRVWREGDSLNNFKPRYLIFVAKRDGSTSHCEMCPWEVWAKCEIRVISSP